MHELSETNLRKYKSRLADINQIKQEKDKSTQQKDNNLAKTIDECLKSQDLITLISDLCKGSVQIYRHSFRNNFGPKLNWNIDKRIPYLSLKIKTKGETPNLIFDYGEESRSYFEVKPWEQCCLSVEVKKEKEIYKICYTQMRYWVSSTHPDDVFDLHSGYVNYDIQKYFKNMSLANLFEKYPSNLNVNKAASEVNIEKNIKIALEESLAKRIKQ